LGNEPCTGTLTSSIPLQPFTDPDDDNMHSIDIGKTIRGAFDFSDDIDAFPIVLEKGESIHVLAESMAADIAVRITTPDDTDKTLAEDDDSGGGLYDINAELSYTAPETGKYLIVVEVISFGFGGGYFLTVEPYEEGYCC